MWAPATFERGNQMAKKQKLNNRRGFVAVSPDGVVFWGVGGRTRRGVIAALENDFHMERAGWRIRRCRVEGR